MLVPKQKVMICNVVEIERRDKPAFYMLDFYVFDTTVRAQSMFINADDVAIWTQYVGKIITTDIDVSSYQGRIQYRLSFPTNDAKTA